MAVAARKLEPTLHNDRVMFTPLQIENIYTHFAWNNDPELNHLDSEVPYEEESFSAFKPRFEQLVYRPAPGMRDFEIHAEDGTLIGVAYVTGLSEHNRHCTIGVTIGDRDYWGKGYGRASLRLLLAYCFDDLGMHRVSAETFEFNDAWRRLVEWAGFTKEGTERDYIRRDGRFWSKELYGLLEETYRAHDWND